MIKQRGFSEALEIIWKGLEMQSRHINRKTIKERAEAFANSCNAANSVITKFNKSGI